MAGRKKISMITAGMATVLAVAVLLAVVPWFASDRRTRLAAPLHKIIPATLDGWQVRDLELADSEEVRSAVIRILRFDEVVYRSYRRSGIEVQIYAAYWKPGSVPYGQAGVHTPDTCWVNAGWKMENREHARSVAVRDRALKPVEIGGFSKQGHSLHVMFWHLVGSEVHSYEQYGWRDGAMGVVDRLPNFFRDLRRYGLNLAQEQTFLRISSNVPMLELLQDPGFAGLLLELEPLGIFVEKNGLTAGD
jgi:hypothetical protein